MTSRRAVLAGAVLAPLVAVLGREQARAGQRALYRIVDGWGEARLSPAAVAALRDHGATVYAIEPAVLVGDSSAPVVRMPVTAGTFGPDFADGQGAVAGGVGVRTDADHRRVTAMSGSLRDTTAGASATVNDELVDVGPLETDIRKSAKITVEQGAPGHPSLAKVEVPVRATPEALDLFTKHLGEPVFDPGTDIAHVVAQFRFLSAG